jgi:sorbitol-specific phosphotransferase system component IIBC
VSFEVKPTRESLLRKRSNDFLPVNVSLAEAAPYGVSTGNTAIFHVHVPETVKRD